MSQIYLSSASTPAVATSFVTDSGTATPVANIINMLGASSEEDDANGIRTRASGQNLYIELTNRFFASFTTSGATTANLIEFDLGNSAAAYRFYFEAICRDAMTNDANGYTLRSTFVTDGVSATRIDTPYTDEDEAATLLAGSIDMVASGNDAVLQVTGVAGANLSWSATGYYVTV